MKLNLGCGKDIKNGYLNVDISPLSGVNKVINLNRYPWPLKDRSFKEIYCDNILEHLDNIVLPMEEIWRICKDKARVIIKVPAYPSIWAFSDPTHKSVFTLITLDYFRPEDGLNYYSKARFKIINKKIIFNKYLKFIENIVNLNPKIQKTYYLFLSLIVPPSSLFFELEAVK